MTLLFIDGFDHYTSTSGADFPTVVGSEYTYVSGSNRNIDIYTMPELGGLGVLRDGGAKDSIASFKRAITPKNTGTLGAGCHFYYEGDPNGNVPISFENGSTALFRCQLDASGFLTLYSGSTLLDTSDSALSANTLWHIEIKVVFGDSGSVEVQVNGQASLSATGIDTNTTAVNGVGFLGKFEIQTGSMYADNLYIWNEAGSLNNDWLGERNVFTLFPDGDTATADWALSSGTDGYALLDDTPPVPGTNYVESSTVGDTSVFTLAALPSTDITIIGVQSSILASKTGTSDTVVAFGKSGATTGSASPAQDSPAYYHQIDELNPADSLEWEAADLTGFEFEIERTT